MKNVKYIIKYCGKLLYDIIVQSEYIYIDYVYVYIFYIGYLFNLFYILNNQVIVIDLCVEIMI